MTQTVMRQRALSSPPIIAHGAPLFASYDVIFSDVWGVVHDGITAHPTAADALVRFRQAGGTVILVSNAPVPNFRVAEMLDDKQLPREAWDAYMQACDWALLLTADEVLPTDAPWPMRTSLADWSSMAKAWADS